MDTFILIVGHSGTGKTTLLQKLKEDLGLKETLSLTTRARRPTDTDDCYRFVTREEFEQAVLVERTEFNGNLYGTSKDDIDASSILVADVHGCQMVKKYLQSIDRPCIVIGVTASKNIRAERMRKRGDSEEVIASRLAHDEEAFENLRTIVDYMVYDFDIDHDYAHIKAVIKEW